MSDLLPCPFCGSAEDPDIQAGLVRNTWIVVCGGCGGSSDYEDSEASAISAWNRRAPDPALLALARLGAWVAASHADEPGDIFAPDIEDAEDKFGVVVTHRPPVGHCALGGERGDDCPCSEYFGMDEQCECRLFAPGIADAIARLLAPDGADGAGEVTDGD